MDTKPETKKPGRPPLPTDKVLSKCIEFRCTEAQYAEYVKRGAQEAVRSWLDNAQAQGEAQGSSRLSPGATGSTPATNGAP